MSLALARSAWKTSAGQRPDRFGAWPQRLGVLGVGLSLLTITPRATASDVKITDAARKHFMAGVSLLKDPDGARYEEAYREFNAAYAASPSWKILGNLGIAAMKLERDGEAIAAFEKYLAEGKKELDAAERADVARDLNTLRASTAQVTLTSVPVGAAISDERSPVQGSPVRNRYQMTDAPLTLSVRPGHHSITASLPNKTAQTWELDADSSSSQAHTFDFEHAAQAAVAPQIAPVVSAPVLASPVAAARPVPSSVFIGLAATGAFAIGAGVTGVLALGKNSDYEAANGRDAERAKSLQDSTKTLNLVTDVLIGAAFVSAGVTTYLYLQRPEQRSPGLSRLRFAPRFSPRHAGLALEGAF